MITPFPVGSRSGVGRWRPCWDPFIAAQQLWEDSELLELPACTTGEPRFLVIGRIDLMNWSVVLTYRDSCIRLISVRRSRPEEVELYEKF